MKLLHLAAAALAAACLSAPAWAADPPTTPLPLGTPNGTTYNEATYSDGTYLFPKTMLHGWTGSAAKPLSLDTNGNPSVSILGLPLPPGASTSALQSTGNGYLSTVAGAVLNSRVQIDCITGCSGSGGGSIPSGSAGSPSASVLSVQGVSGGTGVPVTGTFYQGTQPVSAAALPLPAGAATSAKQDTLLAALGTPLQAGGPVTVTGGATAANQATGNTSLASILAQLQATLSTKAAPFTTATPLTPGTPVTAGRALFLACTAAGTVRIKLSSGNTLDVPVYVGPNELTNYAVTDIVAGSTTATCVATVLS